MNNMESFKWHVNHRQQIMDQGDTAYSEYRMRTSITSLTMTSFCFSYMGVLDFTLPQHYPTVTKTLARMGVFVTRAVLSSYSLQTAQ